MSSLKKCINFKMLESELDDALKADELYKLQNAAKIRAIEQRVPTYDHFRDMVQAAHLRPLERAEMKKRADVSWNHCYNKNEETIPRTYERSNLSTCKSNENSDHFSKGSIEPQSSAEFLNIWKNLTDLEEKFDFLLQYRNRNCFRDKFFKIEIPSEFLEEFFKLSLEICSLNTVSDIIKLLEIFSACNRFSLNLAMISVSGKHSAKLLFEKLLSQVQEAGVNTDRLNNLTKIYCNTQENKN